MLSSCVKPPLIFHSLSRKQNQAHPLLLGSSMNSKRDTRCRSWAVTLRTVAALILGLFATAEAAQTTLAWDRSQNPEVVGYRLHYGTTSKRYDKTVDVGNTTTATVSNLAEGSGYYFAVTAYNSVQIESLPSTEVFRSVATELIEPTLTWDRSTDPAVAGYRVRYGTSSGKYDKTVDVGGNNTATLSGLTAGSSYYAVVTAYNSAHIESLPSNEIALKAETQTSTAELTSAEETSTANASDSDALATTTTSTTSDPNRVALKAALPREAVAGSTTESVTAAEASLSSLQGTYIGVITSSTPSAENAGAITLNTTAAGKFTGKLTLGGKNYPLKGLFDTAGTATVSLPRANGAPLAIKLQASASGSAGELSGTVSDGTTVSEVVGDRAATKAAASVNAGKWTVLLTAPETLPGDTVAPQGAGHATIQVSPKGAARIRGTLSDGTAFSYGTSVSKSNYLYVYAPLYQKRGVLAGVLELKSDTGTGGAITGSVQWIKPAGLAGQTLYPEGFNLDLNATGESYSKATASKPGRGFPSTNGISTITLSGGDLQQTVTRTLSISAAGKVSVTDPGTEQLKVTVNVNAGTFSGSFLDGVAKQRRRFSGAVLQTQAIGGGAFQGTSESGSVTLTPKE